MSTLKRIPDFDELFQAQLALDDLLAVWDSSTGTQKYITVNALIGNLNAAPLPTSFTVSPSAPNQLTLTWVDESNGLATYQVQKSTDGITYVALVTTSAGAETYVDSVSLNDNTQYYYRIRSDIGGKTSAWVTANGTTFNPFRLTIKTDNAGTSASDAFAMPLVSGGTYNFNVWYNGVIIKTGTTHTDNVITFADGAGTKEILITGIIHRWQFSNTGDRLKILNISKWGCISIGNNLTDAGGSFYGCTNLNVTATDIPDFSATTSLRNLFRGCSSLTYNISINNWDLSTITDIGNVFFGASLFNQSINNWNVANVTVFAGLFYQATSFNQSINDWDTSSGINFDSTFFGATSFNQPLNNWELGNATTTANMFYGATVFNQPLNNWNVGSVTTMQNMFRLARAFNQNIGAWNVGSVGNFDRMFACQASGTSGNFNNGGSSDINNWNTASATNITHMFEWQPSFNQPLNNWNVANVTNMSRLFAGSGFNQPLNLWNTVNVTTIEGIFAGTPFNQNIASWNVSKVVTFTRAFDAASAFNQNLGSWDVISRTGRTTINMTAMLNNCGMNTANYDSTLVGWEAQTPVSGVTLGASGRTYTAAGAGGTARASLISTYGWTITDAGGV